MSDRIKELRAIYDDALDMCDSRTSAASVTVLSIESMFKRYNTRVNENTLEIWGEHAKYLITDPITDPDNDGVGLGHHRWVLRVIQDGWSQAELDYLAKLGPRVMFPR
jgi:hypothetical protein